jgi:cob(I)alamin adenosyltransferase
MKVYTKTGDKGTTSLIGGSRVQKNNERIEAYGTVDELNSFLGLLMDKISLQEGPFIKIMDQLADIQQYLFVVGANLACDQLKLPEMIPPLDPSKIKSLEDHIDHFEEELPKMTHFILPRGHELVSLSHCLRTICRRAERCVVNLERSEAVIVYLNRLSDYFFVLSRYWGLKMKVDEVKWIP